MCHITEEEEEGERERAWKKCWLSISKSEAEPKLERTYTYTLTYYVTHHTSGLVHFKSRVLSLLCPNIEIESSFNSIRKSQASKMNR